METKNQTVFLLSTFLRRKNAKQSKQRSRFSFPEPTNKVIFFYLNKIQHFWAKHLNDNSENFRQFFCLAALLKKKYFGRLWIRSQVFFCNLKNGWFSFSTVGNSICVLSRVCLWSKWWSWVEKKNTVSNTKDLIIIESFVIEMMMLKKALAYRSSPWRG